MNKGEFFSQMADDPSTILTLLFAVGVWFYMGISLVRGSEELANRFGEIFFSKSKKIAIFFKIFGYVFIMIGLILAVMAISHPELG